MIDIIDAIKKYDTFIISTHKSPDGDAIGSCVALGLTLKKLNKKVNYIIETPVSQKLMFLPEITEFQNDIYSCENFQVGIFLDCSDTGHLHDDSLLKKCKTNINIDHHISNTQYGDINYIDKKASATGEIIYNLIENLSLNLDRDICISLYTAIVTDTGNFKYTNVTSNTHNIISKLYKYYNNYWDINKKLFDEHPYEKVKLIGKALNNLYLIKDNRISIIFLTLNDLSFLSKKVDIEGIINYARDIQGVEIAIMLKEVSTNVYKVSFRSNTDYDVSKLAVLYGGGGHSKASGCTIEGTSLKETIDNISEKLNI